MKPKTRSNSKTNWQDVNAEIFSRLDLRAEFESLGVEITGRSPRADGWIECRAVGREDRDPSAAVNLRTGRYKDSGGDCLSLSLFDLAVHVGRLTRWQDARAALAAKAGVSISSGGRDPAEHLEFRPWNEVIVALWCRHKAGVTPEAVRAAGGRLARYRHEYTVVALPVFGPALADADPIGWVLYNTTGLDLPVFRGKGQPPSYKKMKTTAGSEGGLLGADALVRHAQAGETATVWLVEGPADMLSLWAAMSPDERKTNLVLSNSGGAGEQPKEWMATVLLGRRVFVVRDADQAGTASAERWSQWAARHAAEVRVVPLPYPIEANHGKDVRDYLADGHTFAELLERAEAAEPVEAGADECDLIEADDDPHRLAGVFLDTYRTAGGDLKLRYWREEWWSWSNGVYRLLPTAELRAVLTREVKAEMNRLHRARLRDSQRDEQHVVRKVTRSLVSNVLSALESLCVIEGVEQTPAWLGTPTAGDNCIAMQNGLLDLDRLMADEDDGVLLDHSPRWFSDVRLPYPFDPHAKCPLWREILRQNQEDDTERISLLQEWAGYCLTRDTGQQKFLVLEGDGSNGKSVFLAGIEAMLGPQNVSHVALETFGQRFTLTETLGKLANHAADTGEIDKVAEGHLKSFTGGDVMFFDRKNKPGVSASPTARLVLACNNRPRFTDRSTGIWRRMMLVPFRVKVAKERKVANMDKPAWWVASGELPGVFNWAIIGLARLQQRGQFQEPKVCNEAVEEYRLETNPARAFLVENCEANSMDSAGAKELYGAYKTWCGDNGCRPLGSRQFGKEIRRVFPETTRKRGGSRGHRFWYYEGLTLLETEF